MHRLEIGFATVAVDESSNGHNTGHGRGGSMEVCIIVLNAVLLIMVTHIIHKIADNKFVGAAI